jgi:tRNA-dihydrouridine synthase B
MAPMAGITNLPFRLMVKSLGAGLVTTEMISSIGLVIGQERTRNYLRSHPGEGPLAVQLFGSRPEAMARAAQMAVEQGALIVDINMGCPAKKIVKTGAGASLLRDRGKAARIITAVRFACPVPLTVKIRAGWSPDQPVACDVARIAEDCGADAITVHGRFAGQGFSEQADWKIIRDVRERVKIPVIGNGDVFEAAQALKMRTETGCDGVMIGRGAVGNPWIFRQILHLGQGLSPPKPTLRERRSLIMEHHRQLSAIMGEDRAARSMRGLLIWYTKGLPRSSRFRGKISRIMDLQSLTSAMDHYFSILSEEEVES